MDTPTPPTIAPVQSDADVGALAGVTHLLFFAQTFGMIVAIVLWVTRGKVHRNLAYQCAQSIIFQAGFLIINVGFWMVSLVFWVGGSLLAAALASSESNTAEGFAVAVSITAFVAGMAFYFLIWIGGAGISIWLAVRCFQGHEPALPGIGTLATRATGYRPTAATSAKAS